MLVHICCSVDSHYFLQRLRADYPNEELVGFFYDPNIHPYAEYRLRYLDVERSCKALGISLLEGPYNIEEWFKRVKGYELEPEKGERCTICFDERLLVSLDKAKELGHKTLTSTLLVSPKKSQEKLAKIGSSFKQEHGVEFIFKDYRSGNGSQEQNLEAKRAKLYRQDYCGCMFALNQQRSYQNRLADELFSPITQQVLPATIEERLTLYTKRLTLEEQDKEYRILKERFLNYKEFFALVKENKKVVTSKFLFFSTLRSKKANGRIEFSHNEISYLNRDEVKFIDIKTFNTLANTQYANTRELSFANIDYNLEIQVRQNLLQNSHDMSCLIVLDKVNKEAKYEIFLDSKVFEDVRENLVLF